MKRRQSECFRNLDDPLKIFSLLTFKSCGLVLLFYAGAVATEVLLGLWSLLFAEWGFLAQLVAAGLLGAPRAPAGPGSGPPRTAGSTGPGGNPCPPHPRARGGTS